MTTQAQIDANRRNAQKSTGPKGQVGKHRSSGNAVKHKLLASSQTLAEEDREAYEAVLKDTIDLYGAETAAELTLARKIADEIWWLDRCMRTRTQLVRYRRIESDLNGNLTALNEMDKFGRLEEDRIRKETPIKNDKTKPYNGEDEVLKRQYINDLVEALRVQHDYLFGSDDQLAHYVANTLDELAKLDRYETARIKSLTKTQKLLEDMVEKRKQKESDRRT